MVQLPDSYPEITPGIQNSFALLRIKKSLVVYFYKPGKEEINMKKLENVDALIVRQKKEWAEILTGFDTKNKYSVFDPSGKQIYFAAEKSSVISRLFLKNLRPFSVFIVTEESKTILKFNRPFRFIFHEIHINDKEGKLLGKIKKKFTFFVKKFIVEDSNSNEIYKINGPLFHPWTFRIMKDDNEVGKISKKWSGLGKEMFTKADNFNISFPQGIDVEQKSILLGALFLIDMLYFEKSN